MKKTTLKQIAELAGVSMTTVHRALNGKGGCSAEMEENIRRIAEEQGYTMNLAASVLRKQPLNIAMIFPFHDNGGKYGLDQIFDGYLEYRREAESYNIMFQEFLLRSNDMKESNYLDMEYPELEKVLSQIYNEQPVRYDGVIVYGMSVTRRAEAMLNRIMGKGTRVVVMERVLPSMEDACTVKANVEMSGYIAVELMDPKLPGEGTVAVISKDLPGGDPAARSFVEALERERPELKLAQLSLVMNVDLDREIVGFLKGIPDLAGIYSTSGRHTASLLKAMEQLQLRDVTVVGTELFDDSYRALKEKVIGAAIDTRPYKIGYKALEILVSSLSKKTPLPVLHHVPPRIILRSNCDTYFVKRKHQYESEWYTD